jgi:hypothetical protein
MDKMKQMISITKYNLIKFTTDSLASSIYRGLDVIKHFTIQNRSKRSKSKNF